MLPFFTYTLPLIGAFDDPAATIFMVIWISVLLFILYNILKSCFTRPSSTRTRPRNRGPGGPGSWGSSWFPGGYGGNGGPRDEPPPPYSKHTTAGFGGTNTTAAGDEGWRPGFWTGAALGGFGTYLMNRNNQQQQQQQPTWRRTPPVGAAGAYDWENERLGRPVFSSGSTRQGVWGQAGDTTNRGEGSSNLGEMRRSTGFGGSSVR